MFVVRLVRWCVNIDRHREFGVILPGYMGDGGVCGIYLYQSVYKQHDAIPNQPPTQHKRQRHWLICYLPGCISYAYGRDGSRVSRLPPAPAPLSLVRRPVSTSSVYHLPDLRRSRLQRHYHWPLQSQCEEKSQSLKTSSTNPLHLH